MGKETLDQIKDFTENVKNLSVSRKRKGARHQTKGEKFPISPNFKGMPCGPEFDDIKTKKSFLTKK